MAIGLDAYRYRFDDPDLYGLIIDADEGPIGARALPGALAQHIQLSAGVFPRVHDVLAGATATLGLEISWAGFLYASPEAQASVLREPDGRFLIFVSSRLVELLSHDELRFVIGHEFGHAFFGHHAYPRASEGEPDECLLELSRAAELSADRIGVVCCASVGDAMRAIAKTASGLGDEHLELDLVEYLRQGAALKSEPDANLAWSTHPPLILRARAALRFESILHGARAGDDVTERLSDLDDEVFHEMDLATHGQAGSQVARDAAFWTIVSRACSDGHLDHAEQERMVAAFGTDRVDALRRMLEGETREGALALIEERLARTHADLVDASVASKRRFDELVGQFRTIG